MFVGKKAASIISGGVHFRSGLHLVLRNIFATYSLTFSYQTARMLTVLNNPLVKRDVALLRDVRTTPDRFRAAMQRIGTALAVEAAQTLTLRTTRINTPLEETDGYEIAHDVVLLPVLRAGVSLVEPFSNLIPEAKIAYIGLARDEATLATREYYYNVPVLNSDSVVYVLDPMLATGDRKSTRLNSSHLDLSRMPSSA